jgi:hypothetical protein
MSDGPEPFDPLDRGVLWLLAAYRNAAVPPRGPRGVGGRNEAGAFAGSTGEAVGKNAFPARGFR